MSEGTADVHTKEHHNKVGRFDHYIIVVHLFHMIQLGIMNGFDNATMLRFYLATQGDRLKGFDALEVLGIVCCIVRWFNKI